MVVFLVVLILGLPAGKIPGIKIKTDIPYKTRNILGFYYEKKQTFGKKKNKGPRPFSPF